MARRPYQQPQPQKDTRRINELIEVPEVRLVAEDGEVLGVVPTAEAIAKAEAAGLDLVEMASNASPPVCKILDYGKLKYEDQKRKAEARKKQKTIEVKEIKMRPGIESHDYDVKMRAMNRFLGDGDKVKVTLRFRGREMAHQDLGMNVLNRVKDDLESQAKVEQYPRMEGRQMVMVLVPR
ncbi:MAG: translation initiation factor IF-3 [Alphaproteobacteria bacterium]|nr:translation initiation factor IF-3 [Alphaproteobacteria bacterium]